VLHLRFSPAWLEIALLLLATGSAGEGAKRSIPSGNGCLSKAEPLLEDLSASEERSRCWRVTRSEHWPERPAVRKIKPLLKLKNITVFDLDDSKKHLVLEAGYRYITAPGAVAENRLQTIATSNFPINAQFLISDRNLADLDWKNGFTWRYRNKLTIERTFTVHSYHLIPYAAAEAYYESQYAKWSTTDLYAGFCFRWANI
jgi:hypothetical protein